MNIYGLQKMTLLDFPGHVACTVFLGGCDFRCPFCHNYELACMQAPVQMEDKEFFAFLEKRHGLLDGVAVTGGEPCLTKELPAFLEKVQGMGFLTKLDTNGAHPEILRQILSDGLADYVAMDIKNSPDKYAQTAGITCISLDRIQESIHLIMTHAKKYEFRTTVVKELHEIQDFDGIGELIRGAEQYYLQPFADRDTVPFDNLHTPGAEELEAFRKRVSPYVRSVMIRGV